MGSLQRRQREKQGTQAKILAAARRLLLRHGYEGVSMRAIASAIQYTPAALYVHFKNKDDLIRSLIIHDMRMFEGATRERAVTRADPVERLRELGRGYARFALEHPHHFKLLFMTAWPQDQKPCSIEEIEAHTGITHGDPEQDGYAYLRATIAACIEQGRFLPQYRDVDRTTQLAWATAHGVASLYITHGEDPWVQWAEPLETAYLAIDASVDAMTGFGGRVDGATSTMGRHAPGGADRQEVER
jgi:AcrR family transcriptional regulator